MLWTLQIGDDFDMFQGERDKNHASWWFEVTQLKKTKPPVLDKVRREVEEELYTV